MFLYYRTTDLQRIQNQELALLHHENPMHSHPTYNFTVNNPINHLNNRIGVCRAVPGFANSGKYIFLIIQRKHTQLE